VTASFCDAGRFEYRGARRADWFRGARVIEQTIRQKLPEGFSTLWNFCWSMDSWMPWCPQDMKGFISNAIDLLTS